MSYVKRDKSKSMSKVKRKTWEDNLWFSKAPDHTAQEAFDRRLEFANSSSLLFTQEWQSLRNLNLCIEFTQWSLCNVKEMKLVFLRGPRKSLRNIGRDRHSCPSHLRFSRRDHFVTGRTLHRLRKCWLLWICLLLIPSIFAEGRASCAAFLWSCSFMPLDFTSYFSRFTPHSHSTSLVYISPFTIHYSHSFFFPKGSLSFDILRIGTTPRAFRRARSIAFAASFPFFWYSAGISSRPCPYRDWQPSCF